MALTNIRIGGTKKIRLKVMYNGEPLDVSSDTIAFTLKTTETASTALVSQNLDVDTQGASGVANLTLSAATTALLTAGKKFYKFVITRSSGEVYVLSAGNIYVIAIYPS